MRGPRSKDIQVATRIPIPQNLVANRVLQQQELGLPGKKLVILGLGHKIYRWGLEYIIVPKSKEVLPKKKKSRR